MEKLIYNIFNKIFMNEVEPELLNYTGEDKNKIIFDVGCFRGNFTRNIIKQESKKNGALVQIIEDNPIAKLSELGKDRKVNPAKRLIIVKNKKSPPLIKNNFQNVFGHSSMIIM